MCVGNIVGCSDVIVVVHLYMFVRSVHLYYALLPGLRVVAIRGFARLPSRKTLNRSAVVGRQVWFVVGNGLSKDSILSENRPYVAF
jgi:hypothetical protein